MLKNKELKLKNWSNSEIFQ